MVSRTWLTPTAVVQHLRRRWQRGEELARIARNQPWTPLAVPLSAPSSRDVADRFADVQSWVRSWEAAPRGLRVEHATIGGRLVGSNRLPVRVWVDRPEDLWRLLGVRSEVSTFTDLVALTPVDPPLLAWVADHPEVALSAADQWQQLVAVVLWLRERGGPNVHMRQVDVPGVDTKFIERHQGLLAQLLDVALPAERIHLDVPRARFAQRYGLATLPASARLRRLDGAPLIPWSADGDGPAEITARIADLARFPVAARRVVILENEITYHALPVVENAVAIVGGGYAISQLAPLRWLCDREISYWGDLDTHGFAILDRLRIAFPRARSLLMDRATLETHRDHWAREARQQLGPLTRLTPDEAALHRDLVEGAYGEHVRLEQERLRFGLVEAALKTLP
jgi:hypothetical protein